MASREGGTGRSRIGRRTGLVLKPGTRRSSPRMPIDVVSCRDPGGVGARCACGAALAALRTRLEVLTANVGDLAVEIRGLRAAQARRRGDSEQDDRDGLLGLLVAEFVGDHAFSAAAVIALGVKHVELQHALAFAGASNGRKLGHLLARLEARPGVNDGVHFVRIGADRSGVLWRVLRD